MLRSARVKRLVAVAVVALLVVALQAASAMASRRVTGQVLFHDTSGHRVHASFHAEGDDGVGSGRVTYRNEVTGESWEGVVDCVDFPPTGAGWANVAGRIVASSGTDPSLGYFHAEAVGQGQGDVLPDDHVRFQLLPGPFQGEPVVSSDPFVTDLVVGEPGEPASCLYGADLAWGILTDAHRVVVGGNLQVHGVTGKVRQHGMGADGEVQAPGGGGAGHGGNGGAGAPDGTAAGGGDTAAAPATSGAQRRGSSAADRRATGGVVFDDGGEIHVTFNLWGGEQVGGAGGGTVRVRSRDLGLDWTGDVTCIDFVAGFVNASGPTSGAAEPYFFLELVGNGQGLDAPDGIKLEMLDAPYAGLQGGCLYGTDLSWGTGGFLPVIKGNLQVHRQPGRERQHDAVQEQTSDVGTATGDDDGGAAASAGSASTQPPGPADVPTPTEPSPPAPEEPPVPQDPAAGAPPAGVEPPPAAEPPAPLASGEDTPGKSGDAAGHQTAPSTAEGNGKASGKGK